MPLSTASGANDYPPKTFHEAWIVERAYWCPACDVLGVGESCWCCGGSEIEHGWSWRFGVPSTGDWVTIEQMLREVA